MGGGDGDDDDDSAFVWECQSGETRESEWVDRPQMLSREQSGRDCGWSGEDEEDS